MVASGRENHSKTCKHGERRDNTVRNICKPLKQYPRDVEGTIDRVRVTILKFSSLLTFFSLLYPLFPRLEN
jgi:hypothetical protein